MARIRTVKPEFWKNEGLSALPEPTHLLAAALLNYADDEGYFNANVALVKAECSPLRDPSVGIQESLYMLAGIGYLELGQSDDGRSYGRVANFLNHQVINRAKPSKIKALSIQWETSRTSHGLVSDASSLEGKGREQGRERNRAANAACVADAKSAIDYLNERTGKSYQYRNTSMKFPIARLNAGMTLDDLKRIVDFKTLEWIHDPTRQQYLRPRTIFGTKADDYLQAAISARQRQPGMSARTQKNIDAAKRFIANGGKQP